MAFKAGLNFLGVTYDVTHHLYVPNFSFYFKGRAPSIIMWDTFMFNNIV